MLRKGNQVARTTHAGGGAAAAKRNGGSFLVRVWGEPRERVQGAPAFRASVRDLRTGEEMHVADPSRLGELLLGHLGVRRRAVDGEVLRDDAGASSRTG